MDMEALRIEMTRKVKPTKAVEDTRTITVQQHWQELRTKRSFDEYAAMMERCM